MGERRRRGGQRPAWSTNAAVVMYSDYVFYTALALELRAIVFWHVYASGDYQPFLLPVDDATWRQIQQ